ncbi:hypothetical protein B0T20DRAFT_423678 [Sordaria brevicollis]|uniref:Uncharacterized protein n=1 Tax=Sordaria brevicollis TaxID=83679 RepID=A0AAE0U5Q9_SORBR|nr:hypothetical protein B0T20DRAFT_423678 [Sordaria brevicollis]
MGTRNTKAVFFLITSLLILGVALSNATASFLVPLLIPKNWRMVGVVGLQFAPPPSGSCGFVNGLSSYLSGVQWRWNRARGVSFEPSVSGS